MKKTYGSLRAGTALSAVVLAGMLAAAPALAQTTPPAGEQSDQQSGSQEIVVTGSLFSTNKITPSPVTSITAQNLEERGINTVAEAIQRISANGSGALPTSFSANGAFASGASAPSLRGLTTSSTLVLFDGLRAAYYPLADDGTRNFVDMNSIPDAIIEKIDVLKDGASSTYGADAVAGVINVITKKEIKGLHLNLSSGISQRGDSGEQRVDATWGFGDLNEKGFNFYVSGEYQHNDALFSRDRDYPYNTNDLSKLCGASVGTATIPKGTTTCRTNSIANGTQFDGTYTGLGTTIVPVVRPYNAGNSAAITGSRYQLLNPSAGCGILTPITLTAAQAASTAGSTAALNNCAQDSRYLFSVISPEQERIGASARLTARLSDDIEAYGAFNYYQSDVFYTGSPQSVRYSTPAGGVQSSGSALALPVYVCNRNGANASYIGSVPQVAGCNATNGTLNPNNPFASLGQTARIVYQLQDIGVSNERLTQSYRGAFGVNGTFGNGWKFAVEGTGMREDLKATYKGYIYIQHLFDVIADGSYNFVNPSSNTQAVRDYLAPTKVNRSSSQLYQLQATISKELLNLPGGPLGVAVGGSFRYEEVNAPSANPVVAGDTTGYLSYQTINRFGTSGNRKVYSGFFELNAPLLNSLEVNLSGRYDKYSSGQKNFSPKIGAKFTPVKEFTLRSTFSKGFRIPSFAEAYGLPTTGYITQTPPTAYQQACAALNNGTAPSYCTAQYSLGLTSVGNPNLKPERSTNFTAGVVFEPVRNLTFTVDYYNIYKKDLITGADYSPQIALYYANNGSTTKLAPGITGVTVDANTPAGVAIPYPLLSTVSYGFINADSQKSTGLDFGVESRIDLNSHIRWISSVDANYVIELSQTINGKKQRYDGTLGAYQTTSASGTPKWRGSWQNTLDFGSFKFSTTVYYTRGYELGAEDDGNVRGVCAPGGSYALYRDGATVVACRAGDFIDVSLSATYKVNDHFTLYGNVLNALQARPPYDPSTYGAYQYNPAWANSGIIGRYFRVGAKLDF